MADKNPVLQIILTAKDEATGLLKKAFAGLNDSTNVAMSKIRESLSGLFGGGLDGARDFEAALSAVAAKGGYTADEMATLKQAAIDIGAKFGVSGADAAKGMEALAAAGLNATQTMQALPPVLALAKAEGVSMDTAAEKLSDSLSAVGLGFDQAGRMADALAKGANISTTSAIALSEALSVAGGIAKTAGLSLEQTVAALASLANAGIKGSAAGTALSAMLTQLQNPASTASKELSALGITSRDLGEVIGQLKAKGDASNAAILAFGDTAGPGLRALISKGQSAIAEFTQQLGDAKGAAADAAQGINSNLNGALAALDAAWTNIKSALAEPVLKPLADAARDAATALNDALSNGALKPIQEAIKAFTVNAVQSARDFIAGFDFKDAITAVQSFASAAKDSFESIGGAGQTAADVVSIAWNSLSSGVKTIGAALLAVASSAVSNLALVEEAASKIGLGSIERATALQQTANELSAKAAALTDSIAKNGESIKSAFERLTTSSTGAADGINKVADAQQRLKDTAPAVELGTVSRSLDDLRGMAERADTALKAAQQGFWAGTTSMEDLGKAADAAAQAHDDLTGWVAASAGAAAAAAPAHQKTAVELQAEATAAEDAAKRQSSYASALQGAGDAQAAALRAEIALARAKGDTVTVATKSIELARLEADTAAKVSASKQAEATAYADVVAKQVAYLASINGGTAAQQQELQSMQLKLAALQAEAVAAGATTERLQLLATAQQQLQSILQNGTQQTNDATGAANQLTDAQKAQNLAIEDGKDIASAFAQVLASQIQYWKDETAKLSDATKALFEYKAGLSSIDPQFAAQTFGGVSAEVVKTQAEIQRLTKYTLDMRQMMLEAPGDIARLFESINAAGADAENSYQKQKLAAEQLEAQIKKVGETGGSSFANVAAAMQFLNGQAQTTTNSFWLLNEQDLSRLKDSISKAKDELKALQDAAQSARDRLAELAIERANTEGDTAKADKLRLALEEEQSLREANQKLQEAQNAGDRETIALIQQEIRETQSLYDLKAKKLTADTKTSTATPTDPTATPTASAAGLSGKTYTLNLTAGGQTLTTTATSNPSSFLDALEASRLRTT